MRFRKLRIAWSVGWGVVTVLVCLLWVRSYRTTDIIIRQRLHVESGIGFFSIQMTDGSLPYRWQNINSDDYLRDSGHTYATGFPGRTQSRVWGHFQSSRYYRGLCVPFWFLMLGSVAVGCLSWLRWRYSLRTLLVATAVVAVALGTIVWMSRAG
jgi:hypothetical protein